MALSPGRTLCTPECTGRTGTSSGQRCTPGLPWDGKAAGKQKHKDRVFKFRSEPARALRHEWKALAKSIQCVLVIQWSQISIPNTHMFHPSNVIS